MIKDIFEDLKRHKTDKVENNRKALELDPNSGEFKPTSWQNI
jgi:hypothetical protein